VTALPPTTLPPRDSYSIEEVFRRSHATSPQKRSKPSVSIALICTTGRRIPASASTHQGPGKGDLIALEGWGWPTGEDAQGTPTQSHISPSILVYEETL